MEPTYNSCGTQVANSTIANTQFGGLGVGMDAWGIWGGAFYLREAIFGGAFGLGGGNNVLGYYRLDRKNNQLWLANMAPNTNTLVMEYIADIDSEDGDFIVNPFFVETIKYFIGWRYVAGDRNTPGNEKEMRRRDYFNELRLANNRLSSSTPEEWAQAMRLSNMAAPRF
jgi:hypothetical protein